MIAALLLVTCQTVPVSTGIPAGADAKTIGKLRPSTYSAMRDYRTLPLIGDLPLNKRATFTGTIVTLDFPQHGMTHVLNYRNGKRVVLENPKKKPPENGVPLTKYLTTLPPNIDIRYAGPNIAGFDVKLPGEEKKLAGFNGTLISFSANSGSKGISITLVNGKVRSSAWLKTAGPRG